MSNSLKRPQDLKNNVKNLKILRVLRKSAKQYLYCSKIYTPATTKVEECTKDEIGVGALIAANNHALKGY